MYLKNLMRRILFSQNLSARVLKKLLRPFKKQIFSFLDYSKNLDLESQHAMQEERTLNYEVRKIVYYVGCPDGESKRYRVFNLVDVLQNQGRTVDVIYEKDLEQYAITPDLTTAVIFRAKYTEQLRNFILKARQNNVDIIFDTDDLVFEPESLEYIGAVRKLDEPSKAWHLNEVSLIRRALLMCDAATTSNDFLASRIRKINLRTGIVRFSLNPLQTDFARTLDRCNRIHEFTRLGFFSGSPTHQADFEEIEIPLFNFLQENPKFTLVVVGYLELSSKWSDLSNQIQRYPFVSPLEMLELMSTIDCLLVPLEMNNPFTNSKAEVKLFESALVYTPVICSGIYSYSQCVKNGQNGILVNDPSGWKDALSLTLDNQLLKKMGVQARKDFVPYFNDIKATEDALDFYSLVRSVRLTGLEPK